MDIPQAVRSSPLYAALQKDPDLLALLQSIRQIVVDYAQTSIRTIPTYTDHTVKHMDALWQVAGQVLSAAEVEGLNPAEVFLLGVGFYLHDIGMAYAATQDGIDRIKASDAYRSFISGIAPDDRDKPATIATGVAIAVRQLHADAAMDLSVNEIPGSGGYYIFPIKADRDLWGQTCGQIASSHHWTIADLDAIFGRQREAPLPGGRKADLFYVAACLRLIDYAHINRDRASSMDRAFRAPLGADSLKHWIAQEHIDGPQRDKADYLIYRGANPIANVDAWWLFYEMIVGLDAEIRTVTRALDGASYDYKRLTLKGVRGSSSPEEATVYIRPAGFLPIEVNLKTGSIEKLVELLAGETLYGPNPMAAIRELVQNARDAVALKSEVVVSPAERTALALPISVNLQTATSPSVLEVLDYGIGMTKVVMTDYLISIASNYWVTQFHKDFPAVALRFKSAGKFGIGFLSVFMLGNEVVVESNRLGDERYRLTLRGVGRRGELQKIKSPSGSGTSIRIKVNKAALEQIKDLDTLLRLYAPALPHDLLIKIDDKTTILKEGWIGKISCEELEKWSIEADRQLNLRLDTRLRGESFSTGYVLREPIYLFHETFNLRFSRHLGDANEYPWKANWPEFTSGRTRLVASLRGVSILSLRGLAVQSLRTPGCAGIIELDSFEPDVSRTRVLNAESTRNVVNSALKAFGPFVTKTLDEFGKKTIIPNMLSFIYECVRLYGREVIRNSSLSWISQIALPGNVEAISCARFVERAASARSIFLVFNTGPWTALGHWIKSSSGGVPSPDEIAAILDDTGQPSPKYLAGDEVEVGSLDAIWNNVEESLLFFTLIALAAEAWQLSPSELLKQDGWSHKGGTVFGRFTRK
jgi:hypothetical protein